VVAMNGAAGHLAMGRRTCRSVRVGGAPAFSALGLAPAPGSARRPSGPTRPINSPVGAHTGAMAASCAWLGLYLLLWGALQLCCTWLIAKDQALMAGPNGALLPMARAGCSRCFIS